MRGFEAPEWGDMFVPDLSLLESFLRGTVIYFAILIIFRLILKRQAGGIGLQDIMLVVLVSEAVSNALNVQAKSITNGVVAVGALVFWTFAVDWATYHWPWLRRRLEPEAIPLVRDGRPLEKNLRDEQITREELEEQLRLNGVEDVAKVKAAFMESSGNISVIEREGDDDKPPTPEPESEAAGDPPGVEGAMRHFLAAAKTLRASVEWHEAQAADHRRAAREARELLTRHGLRGRKWLEEANGAGESPASANGVHRR